MILIKKNLCRKYNKYSILDFGQYKGYELGLIFATHYRYFEWCIETISGFHIEDIDELIEFGCVADTGIEVGLVGIEMNRGLDVWDTYADMLADNPNGGHIPCNISPEILEKNRQNAL